VAQGIEYVLARALMGTNHSRQSGGERVNVLGLSRGQFDATTVRYFFSFMPVDAGIGFPLAEFETERT
jgi:hypothetical protein